MRGVGFVIDLEAVLQSEGVNVHDHRRLPCLGEHVGVVQDFVFLDGDEQDVHLILGGLEQLVAEVHVGDVERNVLAGFGLHAIEEFVFGHQRHADALDDDGVAGNGSGHVFRLDFLIIEDRDDLLGDRRSVHDGAVHDGVLGEGFDAVTDQLVAGLGLLQLDCLDRTRADVQAD